MIKTLRVPLLNLAMPTQPCFLKFFIEPVNHAQEDGLDSLAHTALAKAVEQARAALKQRGRRLSNSRLSLLTPDNDLSSSSGAALGLALTSQYLKAECAYQHFIVTGTLNGIDVGDSGYLLEKMRAVASLGYQTQPTLFLLPPIAFSNPVKSLYRQLAEHNIAVRTVTTLIEAEHFITHSGHNS
jgi:hypothetical protein